MPPGDGSSFLVEIPARPPRPKSAAANPKKPLGRGPNASNIATGQSSAMSGGLHLKLALPAPTPQEPRVITSPTHIHYSPSKQETAFYLAVGSDRQSTINDELVQNASNLQVTTGAPHAHTTQNSGQHGTRRIAQTACDAPISYLKSPEGRIIAPKSFLLPPPTPSRSAHTTYWHTYLPIAPQNSLNTFTLPPILSVTSKIEQHSQPFSLPPLHSVARMANLQNFNQQLRAQQGSSPQTPDHKPQFSGQVQSSSNREEWRFPSQIRSRGPELSSEARAQLQNSANVFRYHHQSVVHPDMHQHSDHKQPLPNRVPDPTNARLRPPPAPLLHRPRFLSRMAYDSIHVQYPFDVVPHKRSHPKAARGRPAPLNPIPKPKRYLPGIERRGAFIVLPTKDMKLRTQKFSISVLVGSNPISQWWGKADDDVWPTKLEELYSLRLSDAVVVEQLRDLKERNKPRWEANQRRRKAESQRMEELKRRMLEEGWDPNHPRNDIAEGDGMFRPTLQPGSGAALPPSSSPTLPFEVTRPRARTRGQVSSAARVAATHIAVVEDIDDDGASTCSGCSECSWRSADTVTVASDYSPDTEDVMSHSPQLISDPDGPPALRILSVVPADSKQETANRDKYRPLTPPDDDAASDTSSSAASVNVFEVQVDPDEPRATRRQKAILQGKEVSQPRYNFLGTTVHDLAGLPSKSKRKIPTRKPKISAPTTDGPAPARPRWYTGSYVMFMALRQAGRPLSKGELVVRGLALDKKISLERGLVRCFVGKKPSTIAAAVLADNRDSFWHIFRPLNSNTTWFYPSFESSSFEIAWSAYLDWTRDLVEKDWPIMFNTENLWYNEETEKSKMPIQKKKVEETTAEQVAAKQRISAFLSKPLKVRRNRGFSIPFSRTQPTMNNILGYPTSVVDGYQNFRAEGCVSGTLMAPDGDFSTEQSKTMSSSSTRTSFRTRGSGKHGPPGLSRHVAPVKGSRASISDFDDEPSDSDDDVFNTWEVAEPGLDEDEEDQVIRMMDGVDEEGGHAVEANKSSIKKAVPVIKVAVENKPVKKGTRRGSRAGSMGSRGNRTFTAKGTSTSKPYLLKTQVRRRRTGSLVESETTFAVGALTPPLTDIDSAYRSAADSDDEMRADGRPSQGSCGSRGEKRKMPTEFEVERWSEDGDEVESFPAAPSLLTKRSKTSSEYEAGAPSHLNMSHELVMESLANTAFPESAVSLPAELAPGMIEAMEVDVPVLRHTLKEKEPLPGSLEELLDVRPSSILNSGNGVYARRSIPKYTYLGFYFGVPMLEDEYDARKEHMLLSNMYTIRYGHIVLDATDPDGMPFTKPSLPGYCCLHFINEDKTRINVEYIMGAKVNQIIVRTCRDILKGEELFVDYGDEVDRSKWATPEANATTKEARELIEGSKSSANLSGNNTV
ncbi:hypothetical protein HDU93_007744 [Gonapodya sp. JEL0774]|nr:hypothetical protein HDU93_007744 [Gonapodya sp. JEL0774]